MGLDVSDAGPGQIRFPHSRTEVIPKGLYSINEEFVIQGNALITAMQTSFVSYLKGQIARADVDNHSDLPDHPQAWPDGEYSKSQLIAVSGPVFVVADDRQRSVPATNPLWCVSIPGINFAYNNGDRQLFSQGRRVNHNGLVRMRRIWHHALSSFRHAKVQYPVLCAIGCGAFAGKVEDVTENYAQALVDVLSVNHYDMVAVFVSLVNEDHFVAFKEAVTAGARSLKCAVVLTRRHGMVGLAHHITLQGHLSGVLNPSDAQAVRQGTMGMYWHYGHIALEELLAVQTTLLMQHIDINPALWERPSHAFDDLKSSD